MVRRGRTRARGPSWLLGSGPTGCAGDRADGAGGVRTAGRADGCGCVWTRSGGQASAQVRGGLRSSRSVPRSPSATGSVGGRRAGAEVWLAVSPTCRRPATAGPARVRGSCAGVIGAAGEADLAVGELAGHDQPAADAVDEGAVQGDGAGVA